VVVLLLYGAYGKHIIYLFSRVIMVRDESSHWRYREDAMVLSSFI